MKQRCPQCYQEREHPREFIGAKGRPVKMCVHCQKNYRGWTKKTPAQRAAIPRKGVPVAGGDLRVVFVAVSKNSKLGGIPATTSSRGTCPPSCSFYEAGCYALYGKLAYHWRNVPRDGLTWHALLERVRDLPEGQLWRHNVAGDLPGAGDGIDERRLTRLVEANRGRRGFTFTHKPVFGRPENARAIHMANRSGFTVNLSAESLADADAMADLGIGPVAVVLPSDAPQRQGTPAGRSVVVCPAETDGLTCAECQLCALPARKSIIGFRAHGQSKALVSELVQLRRKESAA